MEYTKSDIEKIIDVKKNDSLKNHFIKIIKHDYRSNGEVGKNEIKFWEFNLFNAFFYPVFIFKLNSKDVITSISSKLNSFGKLIFISFFVFFSLIFMDFDLNRMHILGILLIIMIYVIFISLLILLFLKSYNFEKKKQLEAIYKKLKKKNIL